MKGTNAKRIIKVFIASPGDLTVERRAFKDTIDELNQGFGRGADVEFVPLGWEDALSQVGRRSQAAINADVDACDVFVLAMWRRWGQDAPDASPYTSYTEEEFCRALTRFEKSAAPTIFVFFKYIDPGQMADAGPQLAKVLAFRRKLEQTRTVLYRPFTDDAAFKVEVDRHLVAFAKGEIAPPGEDRCVPLLPESVLAEMEKLRAEAKAALARAEKAETEARTALEGRAAAQRVGAAKAAESSLALAERAAKAALEGRIEEARQDFAKALDGTTNLRVLGLGYKFFQRIGELDEAERLLRRWLSISGPDSESADTAAAYGNLGLIYRTRGDLNQAEAMHEKALAINEKLGRCEGLSRQYSNLGLIYAARGDLEQAEAMYKKSLAIDEERGDQEGMAVNTGNLGSIYQRRGDLDQAETMHKKALAIDERLGNKEGTATETGNLGVMYRARGDLDQAEAMHKKSLAINEKLGRLSGIAINYGNLGLIAQQRGNMAEARALWTKSRDLYARIGMPHRVKQVQGRLDGLEK